MNRAEQLFLWNVKYFLSNKETRTEVHVFYWNYMSDAIQYNIQYSLFNEGDVITQRVI